MTPAPSERSERLAELEVLVHRRYRESHDVAQPGRPARDAGQHGARHRSGRRIGRTTADGARVPGLGRRARSERRGRARGACERLIVGDVEELDLAAQLDRQRFDYILFLDVLEHLRDPLAVLSRAA